MNELATSFGSGVFDMCPGHHVDGDTFRFIGINAKNREEWLVCDVASVLYNLTIVPFYDSLGPDSATYILNQTELETVLVSEDLVPKYIELKRSGEAGNLRNIIQMERMGAERRQELNEVGLNAFNYEDVVEMGRHDIRPNVPANRDDVYSFSYTSGTTGDPKAVMITHGGIMSMIANAMSGEDPFNSNDVHLSYLPMPHIAEKTLFTTMIYVGARIGIFGGDIFKIRDDLAELKPTIFFTVPRLWNRFYDLISD